MSPEEQREQIILNIADQLRHNPFTYEFKVKKKPAGIKIIYEVTEEQMNEMVRNAAEKEAAKKKSAQ